MADPERQSLINKDAPQSYASFPDEGAENPGPSAVTNNEDGKWSGQNENPNLENTGEYVELVGRLTKQTYVSPPARISCIDLCGCLRFYEWKPNKCSLYFKVVCHHGPL